MTRPVLSEADLNALRRITPTGYANEYRAPPPARVLPMKVGPAGLRLPHPDQQFRPEADKPILRAIAERAFDDYFASIVTPAWTSEVGELLEANLLTRFPAVEMEVLQRWGFAQARDEVFVRIGHRGEGMSSHRVSLPAAVLVPAKCESFRLYDDAAGDDEIVPADTVAYFERIRALRAEQRPAFGDAMNMPGRIITRYRRRVKWSEIETHYPKIGAWMADQRTRSTETRSDA